jgi:thiamine biosynthesis lipoprotein
LPPHVQRTPLLARIPARVRTPLAVGFFAVLGAFAAWQAQEVSAPANAPLGAEPKRVMGTTSRLLAVPPSEASENAARAIAAQALGDAEAALRSVEAEMSTWLDDSPLSRLNRADAGELVPLPPAALTVLHASKAAHRATGGAFDVTARPLIELWKSAGKASRMPAAEEVAAARARSSWRGLSLEEGGARKTAPGVEVDVGGIAKGFAIDRAVESMVRAGAAGGLVDVGGDLRVFGKPPSGSAWDVLVQSPSGKGTIARLRLPVGAVCTSGDYARFVEIQGRRLSHIVDPRSGYPAAEVHSATVVGPETMVADVWATALSVLGRAGFSRLPSGYEAMLVVGAPPNQRAHFTEGFRPLLAEPPPFPAASEE